MTEFAIQARSLGKAYRLGLRQRRAETLAEAVAALALAPVRNFRRLRRLDTFATDRDGEDVLWALKDVSFDIRQGESVGFVGRNGAGKSTLLKVLSRIVEPSEGRATLRGRISSLLEVGTGFHPDLTGRENVYMNGTILGMRKREIDRKFEEIVAFSGVERFLDTPIKRYSSGMKVRLAFSVAAHLEPELLIVDEVLAVGDAEFQRKCLGKMQDVAGAGRTVLFVSHNTSAVQTLCARAIALRDGRIVDDGEASEVVRGYLSSMQEPGQTGFGSGNPYRRTTGDAVLTGGRVLNAAGEPSLGLVAGEAATLEFDYLNPAGRKTLEPAITVRNMAGQPILFLKPHLVSRILQAREAGSFRVTVPVLPLPLGDYRVEVTLSADKARSDHIPNALFFSVQTSCFYPSGRAHTDRLSSVLTAQEWDDGPLTAAAEGETDVPPVRAVP